MPSRTRSSTITIPPPPPRGLPPRSPEEYYEDRDISPRAVRASSRDPSGATTPTGSAASARNRRRSLSNIALMDNISRSHSRSHSQSFCAARGPGPSPGHGFGHGHGHGQGGANPSFLFPNNNIPPSFPASLTVPMLSSMKQHPSDMVHDVSTTAITNTVLPTLSPSAPSAYEAYSPDRPYLPGQPKSLSGIALRAFCLGIALTVGITGTLVLLFLTASPLWRLPFFLTALATFHFLEFWTTARYNTREAEVSSFLLTANWPAYAIAHTTASIECLLTNLLFPGRSWVPFTQGLSPLVTVAGLALVVVGQVVRSAAMVQAGPSFNHIVQQTQKREHILVTTGIYGKLRHPSYFGFFWWGLGTQLAMGNVICFFAYAAVLWRFFSSRIRHEEVFLIKFFGDEYVEYRKRVGTKIPFVS